MEDFDLDLSDGSWDHFISKHEIESRSNSSIPFARQPTDMGPIPVLYTFKKSDVDVRPFEAAASNTSWKLNPRQLGLIPSQRWSDVQEINFPDLITTFFHRKNSSSSRFIHKLYNALRISEAYPHYKNIVGICWVNDDVFLINKIIFARLLGIKAIDGSLFNQQGNFPSHGFIELEANQARKIFPDIDLSVERLIKHHNRGFYRKCKEDDIIGCKWKQ